MRWWLLMAAVGCGGGAAPPVDTDTDTDDLPLDTADTAEARPSVLLTGSVRDGADAPVLNAPIRLCRGDLCRNGNSGNDGTFSFDRVPLLGHSFEVVPPAGSGLATAFTALTLDSEGTRDFTLWLPAIEATVPLPASAAELTLSGGLHITAAAADLSPPDVFTPAATALTSALVPAAQRVPVDGAATVAAMWYVGPFDHYADPGLPLRFDGVAGVADGTYRVWVGSYKDSVWLDLGPITLTDGASTELLSLPLLSTVALVTLP